MREDEQMCSVLQEMNRAAEGRLSTLHHSKTAVSQLKKRRGEEVSLKID